MARIKKVHVADEEMDAYNFAAEIAWRLTSDKFDGPSLDEIFCDPAKAAYFDRAAKRSRRASRRPNIVGLHSGFARPAASW